MLERFSRQHASLPLISFNPEQVLGVAATRDIYRYESITDERTWQDLVISRHRFVSYVLGGGFVRLLGESWYYVCLVVYCNL